MKCFHCSAPLNETARFCSRCGADQGFSAELIARGAAGDQTALTELYNKTYDNVYYTVKALIRDEDTALDILQDSYLKAFRNLNTLNEPEKFRAWIKRIGHNNAVDHLRKAKPMMFSSMPTDDDGAEIEFEDTNAANLPDVVIDQQETARLMAEIIDTLPEDQRIVISMYYYEGLSVRQIAEELGITENTVKSRLSYGRKKIETKVLDLEKKGTKLYGLAPIPFLLLLLRCWAGYAAKSSPPALSNILGGIAGSSASSASSASSVFSTASNTAPASGQSVFAAKPTQAPGGNYASAAPQAPAYHAQDPLSNGMQGQSANYTSSFPQRPPQAPQPPAPQPPYPPQYQQPQYQQVQYQQPTPYNTISGKVAQPNVLSGKVAGATVKAAKKGVGFKILAVILALVILGGGAVGVMYAMHVGPFASGASSDNQEYDGTLYTDPTGTWCVNLPDDWDNNVKINEINPNEMGGADVYFEYDAGDGKQHILLCIYTIPASYGKYLSFAGSMFGDKLASNDEYTVYTYDYRNTTLIPKESFSDSAKQSEYDKLAGEVQKVLDTYRLK